MKNMTGKLQVFQTVLGVVLVCLVCAGPVAADKGASSEAKGGQQAEAKTSSPSNGTQSRQSMQDLVKEAQTLSSKLQTIQKSAFANNPELKEQQKDFNKLVKETLNKHLAAQDVDKERMQAIISKLKEGDLAKGEKEKLMQEYQEHAKGFEKARQQTLKDQEVKTKRNKYFSNMVQAMKNEDPKAEEILKQLKLVQYKIQLRKRQQAIAADMGNQTASGMGNATQPEMGE
jgi:hypothetical protein